MPDRQPEPWESSAAGPFLQLPRARRHGGGVGARVRAVLDQDARAGAAGRRLCGGTRAGLGTRSRARLGPAQIRDVTARSAGCFATVAQRLKRRRSRVDREQARAERASTSRGCPDGCGKPPYDHLMRSVTLDRSPRFPLARCVARRAVADTSRTVRKAVRGGRSHRGIAPVADPPNATVRIQESEDPTRPSTRSRTGALRRSRRAPRSSRTGEPRRTSCAGGSPLAPLGPKCPPPISSRERARS